MLEQLSRCSAGTHASAGEGSGETRNTESKTRFRLLCLVLRSTRRATEDIRWRISRPKNQTLGGSVESRLGYREGGSGSIASRHLRTASIPPRNYQPCLADTDCQATLRGDL